MTKAYKKIFIFLIFVGVIAVAINLMFGNATINMITQEINPTTGIKYYKIDVWTYINNLQQSFNQTTYLELTKPEGTWNSDIVNDLKLVLNWFLFFINVFIYPFRIIAYILKELLVVIGVNINPETENGLSWLVNVVNFLVKVQIPYVN